MSSGQLLRFRLIKFSTLVDLLLIICICDDHDIVLSIPTPRYVQLYIVSLSLNYDPLKYMHIVYVWGSGNGYSIARHIYQYLISFAICWSIHIFYIGLLITVSHLLVL